MAHSGDAHQGVALGSWPSPITSELITAKTTRIAAPRIGHDGGVFWIETRPQEAGRQVLVSGSADGSITDVTPPVPSKAGTPAVNVRTRVHEYGGGEYTLAAEGAGVYFTSFADQAIYYQDLPKGKEKASAPRLVSKGNKQLRFADYVHDAPRKRLIAVSEDHSGPEGTECKNGLSAVDIATGAVTPLASGADFYMSPQLSPDGRQLAWVQWQHPNMPWDSTQLMVASVGASGGLGPARIVAGGDGESVQEPTWGEGGELYFISDRGTGWWNLHVERTAGKVVNLLPREAEFCGPAWTLGGRCFRPLPGGWLLTIFKDPSHAGDQLGVVDTKAGTLYTLDTEMGFFGGGGGSVDVLVLPDGGLVVATVAGSPTLSPQVMRLQVPSVEALTHSKAADWKVLKRSSDMELDAGYLSVPQSIEYPSVGGRKTWMNFYPPTNKNFSVPVGQSPPLLVRIHGGPTGAAATVLQLVTQYFTSRGWAVADVNYGGSTGFGREYRERLKGQWGVVDVDDSVYAAKYLAQQGLVDDKRMCIDGGSAGGFTALAALVSRNVFAAAASMYGVADCELLAKDTHKFESRYLDGLIGPYPEAKDVYIARSPLHHVDLMSVPIIFFQGTDDKVVPPEQAIRIHAAVKAKGLPTALVMFEGEQHGFRKSDSIRRTLDGELFFFGRVLGFPAEMPEGLPEPEISNLRA